MNYRSDAVPTPVVAVETMLLDGSPVPDEISVETMFNGISSGTTVYDVDSQTFDASDPFRFVQRINAPNLNTGIYDWTMTVTLDYGTSSEVVEFTGQQAVINRTGSEFGVGWWLSGLDRLHVDNDGALLENGDGSTFYFADNGSGYDRAVGDLTYATLVDNGTTFTLTDKWGDSRTFNDDGLITSVKRLNSIAADLTYSYIGTKLDKITDISNREITFSYDTSGNLDEVVDIASRPTDVTIDASGELDSVVVADVTITGYTAPEWTFAYQTISGQRYLQSVTEPANPGTATTSYQFDSATRRLNKIVNDDGSDWELFPALTEGYVGTGQQDATYVSDSDAHFIDERGIDFRFQTDGFGNLISFTDGEDAVTLNQYDSQGQLVRSVGADPDGPSSSEYVSPITRYGYSELGNLVLIANPDDTTQEGEYHDTFNRVTEWTNELGNVEQWEYYDAGNTTGNLDGGLEYYRDAGIAGIFSNDFNYTYFDYDEFGNLTQQESEDPDGTNDEIISKYIYDTSIHDRLLEIQINSGGGQTFTTSQEFTYTASDQILTATDHISATETRTTTYAYDPLDRVITITLPDPDDFSSGNGTLTSPVYTYTYGNNLLIESETDPLGNVTNYGYDPDRHFLTSVTQPDPDGTTNPLSTPVTTYEYYADGLLHREFRPEFTGGLFIEYFYDGNGQVEEVRGPLTGQDTEYTYDALGRQETQTDASGRVVTFKYDIRNRVTSVIDHDPDGPGPLVGPTTSYQYDEASQLIRTTDPLGRFTAYLYHDNGLVSSSHIQNPNPEAEGGLVGGSTSGFGGGVEIEGTQGTAYGYDKLNRLVSELDPSGRGTEYIYNQRGQLVEVIAPDPDPDDSEDDLDVRSTFYAHDWIGRTTGVTDVLGRVTSYQHDDLDRITSVTLPDPDDYTPTGGNNGSLAGPVYEYEYDAVGNLLLTIDPLNRELEIQYDNLYRPTYTTESFGGPSYGTKKRSQPQPFDAHWTISYNDQQQVDRVIDPEGADEYRFYDSIGRLTSVEDHFGNETTIEYDLLNRIEVVTAPDPDNQAGGLEPLQTTYTYDILSRVSTIADANGTITQQYNDAGELISLTDQVGDTTRFAYDLLGRLTLETDAVGNTSSNSYNIHGRLVRQANRDGDIIWYGQERFVSTERWFEHSSETNPEIDVATLTEGSGTTNETQSITISNLTTGDGLFRLAFGGETTMYLTYGDASAGDVAEALEALYSIDDVDVNKISNDEYEITFLGQLANTDVATLQADAARMDDGDVIRTFEFEYDAVSRLIGVRDYDPVDIENENDDVPLSADYTWTYDQLDRQLSKNEVIVGLTPEIDLTFAHDIVGRRTYLAASVDGTSDYRNIYTFDYQDRPTWIKQQSQTGGNVVAYKRIEYRYNDIGQLTYINRFETPTTTIGTPSLRTVLEYDDGNRLESIAHKAATHLGTAPLLNDYNYGYDFASRISSINSEIDGLTNYTLDTTNQLTGAAHDVNGDSSGNDPTEGYSYDENGNRINTGYNVTAQNRTNSDGTFNYEYDVEGNRTKRTRISDGSYELNTFDHRNRLVKVEFFGSTAAGNPQIQTVEYTYDAFNQMVRRSVDPDANGTMVAVDQFFAGFDGSNSTLEFDGSEETDLAHRRLWGRLSISWLPVKMSTI